jgi:small-conductance mechanosensitive channel
MMSLLINFLELGTFLGVDLSTIFAIIIISVIAIVLERLIARYLIRFAKRAHLAPNVTNNLILTFRILILAGAIVSIIRMGGLPTEWFVAFSALGGAAIGLASSKTIGNFIAGFYLLASRPFRVGDYVRIGTVEGIVQEITINYTKILTVGNNIVSISNLQIMDRDIINYAYEADKHGSLYCYTFEITFDHSVSADKISAIFSEVFKNYVQVFPKEPAYVLTRSGGFERVYTIYIYVRHPEDIFVFKPQITEEIFKRWDKERKV